jgi:hypothetical protein
VFEPEGPVEVRVRNGSDVILDEGVLYLPRDSILFAALEPGTSTPYQEVERAYRIASARVVSGSDTSGLQVIDYVGEKALAPGQYTYVLAFFQEDHTLPFLEVEKDR